MRKRREMMQLNIRIEKELKERLEYVGKRRHKSVTQLIKDWIVDELDGGIRDEKGKDNKEDAALGVLGISYDDLSEDDKDKLLKAIYMNKNT